LKQRFALTCRKASSTSEALHFPQGAPIVSSRKEVEDEAIRQSASNATFRQIQ
jgi:hypothetical protein